MNDANANVQKPTQDGTTMTDLGSLQRIDGEQPGTPKLMFADRTLQDYFRDLADDDLYTESITPAVSERWNRAALLEIAHRWRYGKGRKA